MKTLISALLVMFAANSAFARVGDRCAPDAAKTAAAVKAGMLKGLQQEKFPFAINAASLTVTQCGQDDWGDDDGQGNWLPAVACTVQFKTADGTVLEIVNTSNNDRQDVYRIAGDYFLENQATDAEGNPKGPATCEATIDSYMVINPKTGVKIDVPYLQDGIPISYVK